MPGKAGRHGVGVPRGLQPQAILEIGLELRRDEARLGKELGGALADERNVTDLRRVEDNQRLRAPAAVLRAAEGDEIDPAPPGHFSRCRAERDERVGEARAVHVKRQPVVAGGFRDRLDLGKAVDRTDLRRLRDRHADRLAGMDEDRLELPDRGAEPLRIHAAQFAVDRMKARPAGKVFGRAALVFDEMRLAMREDKATRPAHRRNGK